MDFDLSSLWRRTRNPRQKEVVLRPVTIPATQATSLYNLAYAPIIAVWQEAIGPIMRAYELSLAQITTDSPADMEAELDAAGRAVDGLRVLTGLGMKEWASRVERMHRSKWRGAALTATGVDLQTLMGPDDVRMTIEATLARNTALISNVSDQTRLRISQAVFDGFRDRRSPAKVSKAIREAVAMSRKRAIRIAADQTVKLASDLNEERRRQAGIDTWVWVHSGKVHYRPEHKARHEKRYTDKTKPNDMPGQLPFCGCTTRAVVMLDGKPIDEESAGLPI